MSTKIIGKDKEIVLKADKNLFGIITVTQSRNLDMKDVLSHPLDPIPLSLATSDVTLRKTNKVSLGNNLEKVSTLSEEIHENLVCKIDTISLNQNMKGNHKHLKRLHKQCRKAMSEKVLQQGRTCI